MIEHTRYVLGGNRVTAFAFALLLLIVAAALLGPLLVAVVARELGPVLINLVVIVRSGSAMTTEVGAL